MGRDESPAETFQRKLKMPEAFARAFESAGYTSIDEIAYVPAEELRQAVEMPDWVFDDIRRRAREWLLDDAIGGKPPMDGIDV